jgi:hypothetical protein
MNPFGVLVNSADLTPLRGRKKRTTKCPELFFFGLFHPGSHRALRPSSQWSPARIQPQQFRGTARQFIPLCKGWGRYGPHNQRSERGSGPESSISVETNAVNFDLSTITKYELKMTLFLPFWDAGFRHHNTTDQRRNRLLLMREHEIKRRTTFSSTGTCCLQKRR